ncbi:glutamate-rich protein 2 [Biomphalaria glabrata]|nr:glutamate-rich protein 2 [Biomphalaria glabrata]
MDLNPALSARSTPSARKLIKQSGSLEIIKGDANTVTACQSSSTGCFSSDASSRPWSRSSVGSVPPRPESASGRGVSTPTKQISLQAVRRKDDSIFPYNDKDFKVSKYDLLIKNTLDKMEHADKLQHWEDDQTSQGQKSQHATKLRLPVEKAFKDEEYKFDFISSINVKKVGNLKIADDKEDSDEDNKSDGEESAPVERRAPNELLMEFIDCLMKKDYKNAEKLCQMILLFEPKNPEALKFQPLLQRKLKLDERAALAGDDDDEDDDESSSDDSDEDSFDDSDDMTSSDESTDLEEKEDKEKELNTISEQSKVAQNPARTILQMIFGGDSPEFINPDTKIDLAEEIKKLDDF